MIESLMPIEEEIEMIFTMLSHSGGFDLDMAGLICIRPVDECCPPEHWEVDWEIQEETTIIKFHKVFQSLREAVVFFVEKRHLLCIGLDFDYMVRKDIDWDEYAKNKDYRDNIIEN